MMKLRPLLQYLVICITIVIVVQFFVHVVIHASITQPQEGDSVRYHIPIAHSIVSGSFFDPSQISQYGPDNVLHYYPSMGESVLALLLLSGIPLNLYNGIGVVLLAVVVYVLSRTIGIRRISAVMVAVGLVTIAGITRWLFSQIIDIYLVTAYLGLILLFLRPKTSKLYFLLLGLVTGFLIGSKFTGIFLAFFAYIVFFRSWKSLLSGRNVIYWLLPVSFLGISWYIRNYLVAGNPLYPQAFLWFPGIESWDIFRIQVWEMIVATPIDMINAYISEYGLFSLSAGVVPLLLWKYPQKNTIKYKKYIQLFCVSLCNIVFFLVLVTSTDYNVKVSSFRYSYPAFFPLIILSARLLEDLKMSWIIIVAVGINSIGSLAFEYHPKYFFLALIPLLLYIFYTKWIASYGKT